jgi:hypothetical protein
MGWACQRSAEGEDARASRSQPRRLQAGHPICATHRMPQRIRARPFRSSSSPLHASPSMARLRTSMLTPKRRCWHLFSPFPPFFAALLAAHFHPISRALPEILQCNPKWNEHTLAKSRAGLGRLGSPGIDGEIKRTGVRWLPSVAKACLHIGFCKFSQLQNGAAQRVQVPSSELSR